MKKATLAVLVVLLAAIAGYWAYNALKPPVQHVTTRPAALSRPYGYDVPVQPASPRPTFRRDRRNSGASLLPAIYSGNQPWAFQTGKGIFSTPGSPIGTAQGSDAAHERGLAGRLPAQLAEHKSAYPD